MQTGEGAVRSGGRWQEGRILRRSGWVPRPRILPCQQPTLGMCFPACPSLPEHPACANQHPPGSARELSGGHLRPEPRALLVVQEDCWLQRASGGWCPRPGERGHGGSASVRKLLGSLSPASRPLFPQLALPTIPLPVLRLTRLLPASQTSLLSQLFQGFSGAPTAQSSTSEPPFPDLRGPHLSPEGIVPITPLAQVRRLLGGGDSLYRGRRMVKGAWGWGGLWALAVASLTPLDANSCPLLRVSHSISRPP